MCIDQISSTTKLITVPFECDIEYRSYIPTPSSCLIIYDHARGMQFTYSVTSLKRRLTRTVLSVPDNQAFIFLEQPSIVFVSAPSDGRPILIVQVGQGIFLQEEILPLRHGHLTGKTLHGI